MNIKPLKIDDISVKVPILQGGMGVGVSLSGLASAVTNAGGIGVISVLSNIAPKETHDMVAAYLEGNTKEALDIQLKYLDFIHALFIEVNPIPVKEALNLMGKNAGGYRLPLCEMSESNQAKLKATMEAIGLC